jgi:hypothetical protein
MRAATISSSLERRQLTELILFQVEVVSLLPTAECPRLIDPWE